MTGGTLTVLQAGPSLSVQDGGRPGLLVYGLSRGGPSDRLAMAEGAALLGQSPALAALEMAGFGGVFQADRALRIALTGAQMRADCDGKPLAWNGSHLLPAGATLTLGAVEQGVYGYLHIGGGIDTPVRLGARGAHLAGGIGRVLAAGDLLPLGADRGGPVDRVLDIAPRWAGGSFKVLPTPQTPLFAPETLARFPRSLFRRDARANRLGTRLIPEGDGFAAAAGQTILSDVVLPGDLQVPGDGMPFVLGCEAGTTGGYPRIATVLPCEMPRLVQTPAGAGLRFDWVDPAEALALHRRFIADLTDLPRRVRPRHRDPRDIGDLLGYQLISGVTAGQQDGDPQ